MKRGMLHLLFISASLALFACSPVRTGVVDGALTTNEQPSATIKANTPYAFANGGRVWASPAVADDVTSDANLSFDYAVYADADASLGTRFAYAAIVRFDDPGNWAFVPQGAKLPGSFGQAKPFGPPELGGTMHALRVESDGDWASGLLAANGVAVPQAWLAKRWVFTLDDAGRAMAEYREAWPDGLDIPDGEMPFLRGNQEEYLRDFERRAVKVFTVDASRGDFSSAPRTASQWKKSATAPDVVRLMGDVRRKYHDDSGGDWK